MEELPNGRLLASSDEKEREDQLLSDNEERVQLLDDMNNGEDDDVTYNVLKTN